MSLALESCGGSVYGSESQDRPSVVVFSYDSRFSGGCRLRA